MFDLARIEAENELVKKYGLKNKREIWKADARIGEMREKAKNLITASHEKQKEFINRLKKNGFEVESIAEVLALDKEAVLKRRLQTVVVNRKIARTMKSARQLITHKHIKINGKKVNIPSYPVSLEEESKIEVSLKMPKKEKEEIIKLKEGNEEIKEIVGEE